ncbi:hypothetical protein CONLIGDRAFT_668017 [Coniochaeta ligniaria NRRL 30616]|uniref:Uncharacterized protein n=1 Tax=Coniochaeta ligniaria NRRL 30616 TaxID=1408157 RepID=A0A1J7JWW5_9PEZI|nr:hypothetical protein CONLIGDRAFT_668017 [Coniochaeta ligniaria NRRL 30616]
MAQEPRAPSQEEINRTPDLLDAYSLQPWLREPRPPTQEEINRYGAVIPPISPPCWRRRGLRIEDRHYRSYGSLINQNDVTSKEALEQYLAARLGAGHYYLKGSQCLPDPPHPLLKI